MINKMDDLYYTICQRKKKADPKGSYTAQLFDRGTDAIAQKVGEEAVETIIEAICKRKNGLIYESVDLLYHLMVLWADSNIKLEDIWDEMAKRSIESGLEEKANRAKT